MTNGMRVSAISIYPVKALHGRTVSEATVEPWGLAGDRRWMVVDDRGRFVTQRQHPLLATIGVEPAFNGLILSHAGAGTIRISQPDPAAPRHVVTVWRDSVLAADGGDDAAEFLTRIVGESCRLVFMADPHGARPVDPAYAAPEDRVSFADGFPLLATTEASLADLNHRLASPVPMSRFRPNIVVAGSGAWAEDGWRWLRVGPVVFESVKPCSRCVVTTVDQDAGHKSQDLEPLTTLKTFRRDLSGQVIFGQNLIPRGTGTIRVGDMTEAWA